MQWEFVWLIWALFLPILVFAGIQWWSLRGVAERLDRTLEMLSVIRPSLREGRAPAPRETRRPKQSSASITGAAKEKTLEAFTNVILDEIAKRKTESWRSNEPTLDAVLHASDIERNLREIGELEALGNPVGWFFTRSTPLRAEEVGWRVAEFVNHDQQGRFTDFKLRKGHPLASICAFDSALRVILNFGLGRDAAIVAGGQVITVEEILRKSTDFVLACRQDGFMAEYPGGKASVFSTFASLETIRNVHRMKPELDLAEFNRGLPKTIASIRERLKPWETRRGVELYAFTYSSESEERCLSADHYALRSLAFASQLIGEAETGLETRGRETEKEEVRNSLMGKEQQFLDFIRLCWSEDQGGFAWQPGIEPDILHTRYALQVLRLLLYNRVIDANQLDWLNPPSILRYVMACHSFGGFAVRPDLVPSLYATRAAVSCVKLLEIFRLRGLFAADWDYLAERSRFDAEIGAISDFVKACVPQETKDLTKSANPKKEYPESKHLRTLGLAA